MSVGTFRVDGRKFRIVAEDEYKALQAAARWRRREAKEEAEDLAEALRRVKDPKREAIPLARLKAELGV